MGGPGPSGAPPSLRIGLLTGWGSRLGGGVFEAVLAQTRLLQALGHDPVVFAPADRFSAEDRDRFGSACEVVLRPMRGPGLFGWAPGLVGDMRARDLDVLHLHGIWRYASMAGAEWAKATKRPYLISPHGMLDPWITARGRLKKAIGRLAYERRGWALAAAFHALTEAEARDIRFETRRSAVMVIPNVAEPPAPSNGVKIDRPIMLYLGRIHPKKNLAVLVRAWRARAGVGDEWRLVVAGWGEPYEVAAFEAVVSAAADPTIAFVGPVFGPEKARLLGEASFMILPSLSEGLPMAILEAWGAGVPCLMSSACNLPIGFACGAAIDCGTDQTSVAAALARASALDAGERRRMGEAARALVAERFSADVVASQWDRVYRGLAATETAR